MIHFLIPGILISGIATPTGGKIKKGAASRNNPESSPLLFLFSYSAAFNIYFIQQDSGLTRNTGK